MQSRQEGLKALINILKGMLPDFDSVYQRIIGNDKYAETIKALNLKDRAFESYKCLNFIVLPIRGGAQDPPCPCWINVKCRTDKMLLEYDPKDEELVKKSRRNTGRIL